ncbi:MAG: pilus assembly protein [Erythrobacter sp.]|nr:pilus assembly protein [Erythrobacter sp.]
MMTGRSGTPIRAFARMMRRSQTGAAVVEFALLAPLFFMMLFGVLQTGIYLQNLNAVQSVTSDAARFVMIEYQKENQLSDEQIRSVILGMATNSPYLLDTDRIEIDVDRSGVSRVAGTTEIDVRVRYTLTDFIPGVDLPLTVIDYSRPVWVVAT